jgi:hypothetical protein
VQTILDSEEELEAITEPTPDPPLAEDWVVGEQGNNGEVKMFEGVRAGSNQSAEDGDNALESFTAVLTLMDEAPSAAVSRELQAGDERLPGAVSRSQKSEPLSGQSHGGTLEESHQSQITMGKDAGSNPPMLPRTTAAHTRNLKPRKQRPLNPNEEELSFLPLLQSPPKPAANKTDRQRPISAQQQNSLPPVPSPAEAPHGSARTRRRTQPTGIMQQVRAAAEAERHEHLWSTAAPASRDRAKRMEDRNDRAGWFADPFGGASPWT